MQILIGMILVLLGIGMYITLSLFLNNYHKLRYDKKTACAWIPILNFYILGKVVINKNVGYILLGMTFLNANYRITIGNYSKTYTLLPEPLKSIVTNIYGISILSLLIYGIIKYNKLKDNI